VPEDGLHALRPGRSRRAAGLAAADEPPAARRHTIAALTIVPPKSRGWSAKLARPIETKHGEMLRTLANVLPDNVAAVSLSVAANAAGFVDLSVTLLLTPDEMDKAIEKSAGLPVPGR
jgi:hypothetical protein